MKITLKDGFVKEYGESRSVYEIAQDISEGLARAACCAKVNGQVTDLRTVISQDCELAICTADDPEGLGAYGFSCAGGGSEKAVPRGKAGYRPQH